MIRIYIYEHIPVSDGEFSCLVDTLPFGKAEKERLLNTKNKDAALSSLCAYLALSKLTKGLGTDSLNISRTSNGKPYFDAHPELPFNLSHSGKLSVAAIGDEDCENIGIDIEFMRNDLDFKKISDRFFGKDASTIQSKDDFFLLWTQKEAAAKMQGKALAETLHESLSGKSIKSYKIIHSGQTAYMTLCIEASKEDFLIEINTSIDNDKIIINKI